MNIKSSIRDYSVEFVETSEFMDSLIRQPQHIFIIDGTVWDLYKSSTFEKIRVNQAVIQPISEDLKNLESVSKLYDHLITLQAKRNITLIVLGGGILQDICGYVASTLYRGVKWIFVPTTLLAQADSCIGGKTSLNYRNYKNLIGTFFPPSGIIIYPEFLLTLSELDYYSGLGEVVKLHIMGGKDKTEEIRSQFPLLKKKDIPSLKRAIAESLLIKKGYIEEDEFDSGRRNMLNYGHCFGHAIETISNFEIPHGQAVVVGMILANLVSRSRGVLSHEINDYIYKELLKQSLLISKKQLEFNPDDLIQAMKKDKKRTGADLALIMMDQKFNFIRVNDLTEQEVQKAISEFRNATP
ncbi:MAG: 3-dehydroquinate synthase [Deltaproteobacteria bacterium]|nr:3-dehydroquinate synthase [Deltaproteobacteria bacterium]